MDLQIHARLSFCTHDSKQSADGFSGLTLATDHLTHIFGIQVESDKHSHLINRALGFDICWMINQGPNEIFYEFLILFLCHICRINYSV